MCGSDTRRWAGHGNMQLMKRGARAEWGTWVWFAVSVMLVLSFLIDVVGWRRVSDVTAALAFVTACFGVLRMPSI